MRVEALQNDAPGFIEQVQACANGLVKLLPPTELILVKIDNWFGPQWLPFSAPTRDPKAGIAANNLCIPLFVPNRVVAQRNFSAPAYDEHHSERLVHIAVRTSNGRYRLMSDLETGTAIIWYSGNSEHTGRGSVLVYLPVGERYHAWYVGFARNKRWQLALTKRIAVKNVVAFIEAGVTAINR
jgi:hypothetical protein